MHCERKPNLRSHNTSNCLIKVVTEADLTVYGLGLDYQEVCFCNISKIPMYRKYIVMSQ